MNEEELRALNDPWVDWFLSEQVRLHGDRQTYNLMHIAGSFGLPGSMTEGGQKFRAASIELELVEAQFLLYMLHKGHVTLDQLNFSTYDKPPKGTR